MKGNQQSRRVSVTQALRTHTYSTLFSGQQGPPNSPGRPHPAMAASADSSSGTHSEDPPLPQRPPGLSHKPAKTNKWVLTLGRGVQPPGLWAMPLCCPRAAAPLWRQLRQERTAGPTAVCKLPLTAGAVGTSKLQHVLPVTHR